MLTALAAVVLASVPGGLLALALPAGRYRWAAWAAAPALTLGLTAIAMGWLPRLGVPDGPVAVLAGEVVLAAALVLAARLLPRRRRRGGAPATRATPPGARAALPGALDLVCVGVPAALGLLLGARLLGRLAAPPGWDAMNHALLTGNILHTGSTTVTAACTSGYDHPVLSCAFYPLAANVSWAQAAVLTGGAVSSAMNAWSVVVAPVFLVASVYACVRALGGRPVVAGAAAAATTVVGPLYASMLTGRTTEEVGPALSVGVALLVALAVRGPHPVRVGALAGVGAVGIVMTHTYDVLFTAVLAAGLVLWAPARTDGRPAARALVAATATAGVTAAVALAPFLRGLLGADGERAATPPALVGQPARVWSFWVTDLRRYVPLGYPQPGSSSSGLHSLPLQVAAWAVAVTLLAAPLCLVLARLRWARPWLLTGVVWTAVGMWTSVSGSAAAMLVAGLWYGTRERVRTMMLPVYGVLAVAGACALAILVQRLALGALRRTRGHVPGATAAAVGAVLLAGTVVAVALLPSTRAPLQKDLARRTPVGASYPRTFAWLARHTASGGVVAYDRNLEMMTWSYADDGVLPLFGISPLKAEQRKDYQGRWRAWDWLVDNPGAAPAGCLVRRYDVRYVVVGTARVPGWPVHYRRARLAASPRVDLVHRDAGIRIYAVNEAGRTCPTGA